MKKKQDRQCGRRVCYEATRQERCNLECATQRRRVDASAPAVHRRADSTARRWAWSTTGQTRRVRLATSEHVDEGVLDQRREHEQQAQHHPDVDSFNWLTNVQK